jgi:hypothetical protein
MATGRDRTQWNHTAPLIATLVNGLLKKKGQRPARFEEYHPYLRRRRGMRLTKQNFHLFAQAVMAQFGIKGPALKPPKPKPT